jgi:hypothetical protein
MGGFGWQLPTDRQEARSKPVYPDAFDRVEEETALLRHQFTSGKISQDEYHGHLLDMVIEDTEGTWWLVGTKSGAWYRYDGSTWIRATPRTRAGRIEPSIAPVTLPETEGQRVTRPSRGLWRVFALVELVVGLAVTYLLARWVSLLSRSYYNDRNTGLAVFIVAALIGLLFVSRVVRRAWRGW